MICYKDMTFCPFYEGCIDRTKCGRAETPEIIEGAQKMGLPISVFAEKPECYKHRIEIKERGR